MSGGPSSSPTSLSDCSVCRASLFMEVVGGAISMFLLLEMLSLLGSAFLTVLTNTARTTAAVCIVVKLWNT